MHLDLLSVHQKHNKNIFSDLGILKFFNLFEVLNILFVHQLFNVDLPEDLLDTFDFSKISHSFNTRGSCLGLLKFSSINTKTYGLHSFSKLTIQQWNDFQQSFPDINLAEISYSNLKYLARKFYLENIWYEFWLSVFRPLIVLYR